MKIELNGKNIFSNPNRLYRGLGMVSANNSSKLLIDYKREHEDAYYELLRHLFSEEGLAINHLKIEMGSDVNSSSGTEPCVMRHSDEPADVTRGAGYMLAADAKKISPSLTLDLLWWSEPRWVTDSVDVYAARYKWYKETLIAAYNTYGLVFDYVSANRNERALEPEWIKYLSSRFKKEQDCPYDFSAIKIVAADEDNKWEIGKAMLEDEELLGAVDVIGSHYTCWSTDKIKTLIDCHNKEVWFSEGSSPMSYPKGVCRYDGHGSGLTGLNGVIDIANRIVAMYPCGGMTLYEYQPSISAYYDGVTFCHKQLISAQTPWNGGYTLDAGYYMSLHFARFFRKGWKYIEDACASDGIPSADGHAITNVSHSCLAATDSATGDYSMVLVNSTDKELSYEINLSNLKDFPVHIWETKGPTDGAFDENYFKHRETITPKHQCFNITLSPYSIIAATTLNVSGQIMPERDNSSLLTLPYRDYLTDGCLRYATDEGGAFEVRDNVLTQIITESLKPVEWGVTPNPTTNFGDDRWFNYSLCANVLLTGDKDSYAGIGVRYILADSGESGYQFIVHSDNTYKLKANKNTLCTGTTDANCSMWVRLKLAVNGNIVTASINDVQVCKIETDEIMCAGRAALYSSYHNNSFKDIEIEPIGNRYAIERLDNTDPSISYNGNWNHELMASFKNYKRTFSEGGKGSSISISFYGTGIATTGHIEKECRFSVSIDNGDESIYTIDKTDFRQITYMSHTLSKSAHTAVITVLDGIFAIDSIEII